MTTVLTPDWLQEFLLKYSNLIADARAMQCSECECSVLLLDFKEMCTRDRADGMIWVGCVLYVLVITFIRGLRNETRLTLSQMTRQNREVDRTKVYLAHTGPE